MPLPKQPLLRWLVGVAVGLVGLHVILVLIWGMGGIPGILPWFAVMIDSFSILAALAIAFVAFGRYQVLRDPVPFWIGVAFTGFALFAVFDVLTEPGLAPGGGGIISHVSATSSWFWHVMLSALALGLLAAATVRWPRAGRPAGRWWLRIVAAGIFVEIVLSVLLVAFEQSLPLLIENGRFTQRNVDWVYALLFAFLLGTVLSAHRYAETEDSLLGFVALSQLVLSFALWSDIIGTRVYTIWWYWARVLSVGAFSIMLFGLLADYIRLFWQERERAQELQALQFVTGALVGELELPRVAEVIVEQSSRVLHVDAVAIWLADPSRRELRLLSSRGFSPSFVEDARTVPYDAAELPSVAVRTEHIHVVEDTHTRCETGLNLQRFDREGMRSLLGICLRARGHAVGVVVYANRGPRHFTSLDLSFITPVADVFAVAFENARLYEEIRHELRLREEFIAAVAHELRSPVTVIQGRAQRTLKVDAREELARAGLEQILHAAERIDHLVDDLVAVLRVHPGGTALHRERFDLGNLTRELVEGTARTTEHYRFDVNSTEPMPVEADRALIGEVLSRFLENGMRYAPEGGRIEVRVRRQGDEAVVSVEDHGFGIARERQRHVFEPFYELIPAGTPGYVGLVSLGLYLSKQIIEAHGGRVSFVSVPGQGSTFSFSLPLRDVVSST